MTARRKSPSSCFCSSSIRGMLVSVIGGLHRSVVEVCKLHHNRRPRWPSRLHRQRGAKFHHVLGHYQNVASATPVSATNNPPNQSLDASTAADLTDAHAGLRLSQCKRDLLVRESLLRHKGTPLLSEMCPKTRIRFGSALRGRTRFATVPTDPNGSGPAPSRLGFRLCPRDIWDVRIVCEPSEPHFATEIYLRDQIPLLTEARNSGWSIQFPGSSSLRATPLKPRIEVPSRTFEYPFETVSAER